VLDDQLAIPQPPEASNAPSTESLNLALATSPPLHLGETPNPDKLVETSLLGTDEVSAHILPVPVVSEDALIQVSESEQRRSSDPGDKSPMQEDPMPPLSEPEAHLSLTPSTSPQRTANVASVVRSASPQLASLARADAFGTSKEISLRQLVRDRANVPDLGLNGQRRLMIRTTSRLSQEALSLCHSPLHVQPVSSHALSKVLSLVPLLDPFVGWDLVLLAMKVMKTRAKMTT
jgi:hypothetical protein